MNVFDKNFKNEPKVEIVEVNDIKNDEDEFQDDREKDEFPEDEIDRMQVRNWTFELQIFSLILINF